MEKTLCALLFSFVFTVSTFGQNVKSVDPEVRLEAKTISGGRAVDVVWSTYWGSFQKVGATSKVVGVVVSTTDRVAQEVTLEGIIVVKSDGRKDEYYSVGTSKAVAVHGRPFTAAFSTSLEDEHDRYLALGYEIKSGDRLRGWLVRAYDVNKRVVAVAASLPHYNKLGYELEIK